MNHSGKRRVLIGIGIFALVLAACELSPFAEPNSGITSGVGAASAGGGLLPSSGGTGGDMDFGGAGGHEGGARECGDVEVVCNGIDDDCRADTLDEPDADGDGASKCIDCHDGRPDIHPGAPEICEDGVDQDCDGKDQPCSVCGDMIVEGHEACDDGNVVAGDGCRADCLGLEVCGDGLHDAGAESCDAPQDTSCIGFCQGCACPSGPVTPWSFAEVTASVGIAHNHSYTTSNNPDVDWVAAGVAASDYNGDGWVDLYAVGGNAGSSTLWTNTGGAFVEDAAMAGVVVNQSEGTGPLFVDLNGDGGLDLFVGGPASEVRFFENQLDGTFVDVTSTTAFVGDTYNHGASAGDYDRDGDLDLAITHWGTLTVTNPAHLWRNDGGFVFSRAAPSVGADVALASPYNRNYTYTATFSDTDSDGWPDLLVAADFGTSRVAHNDQGVFTNVTGGAITDENGMGMAVADYDNDGDFDWFVTAIFDGSTTVTPWGDSGNRLYQNQGNGTFVDVTEAAGVREGGWGWGACFADFNNDGHLDLFHVNGWRQPMAFPFHADASRLFINNGNGTFTDRASDLGLIDTEQGRGVACFDYDRDGDVDLVVSNNGGPLQLFENRLPAYHHYLAVTLSAGTNTQAIGARVSVSVGAVTQTREIHAGNNFESQSPAWAHFGLGLATSIDTLVVRWPDGTATTLTDVPVDQYVHINQP